MLYYSKKGAPFILLSPPPLFPPAPSNPSLLVSPRRHRPHIILKQCNMCQEKARFCITKATLQQTIKIDDFLNVPFQMRHLKTLTATHSTLRVIELCIDWALSLVENVSNILILENLEYLRSFDHFIRPPFDFERAYGLIEKCEGI